MLYNIKNNKINEIKEKPFKPESDLQKVFEANMKEFVNLDFVETEFTVADYRIDTVAFDFDCNSFVIIEYKQHKNTSVIDQGYTYLSTMLNHKADFVLRYNIKFETNKDVRDFDWTQSRVLFVSQGFTKYQQDCINFKDLPIELWKIKKYENDTVSLEQIISKNSSSSIKSIAPTLDVDTQTKVTCETKTYTEEDLLNSSNEEIKDIYEELKNFILEIDDNIFIKPTKVYIGFNRGRKSIVSIKPQKKSLVMWMNTDSDKINDTMGLVKDVTHTGHHGNGNVQLNITDDKNIGYIEDLIKQFIDSVV